MKKISIKTLSITAISVALVSLALRIISLFFFYDKIGYYKSGAVVPFIASLILGISILFFLVASIFFIDKNQSIENTGRLSQYAALLPIAALIIHIFKIFSPTFNDTMVNRYLMLASAVLSIIFFLLIFIDKKKYKTITFYMGIGVLLYVFFCWMYAYFEFSIPINSINKILFYLSTAGALLFIFNEMCFIYGFVRARFYYFSLFASIIILTVSPLSAIIGYLSGAIEGYITFEADIFLFALLIYAIARLIDAQKSKAEKTTEPSITENEQTQESLDDDSN